MVPSSIPPSERSLQARLAAQTSWAKTSDPAARTSKARAALEAKWLADAEGDPVRAAHFRKAHFTRLALLSAQSRRRSRELKDQTDAADRELKELGGEGA